MAQKKKPMVTEQTFEDYVIEFKRKLHKKYAIEMNDCTSEEQLLSQFNSKVSPQQFVNWIGEKYDLTAL